MSDDPITQARLAMRIDRYTNEYTARSIKEDNPSRANWHAVLQKADSARVNNNLTPEMVDDVRIALNKL